MSQYICLLFGPNREAVAVEPIDAESADAANKDARRLMESRDHIVGYEVWQHGTKVATYFRPRTSAER